ncbi:MAG: hypothetical protein V7682_10100 [Cycloclasticus sp.]
MNKKQRFFDPILVGLPKSVPSSTKPFIATHHIDVKHPTVAARYGSSNPTVVTHPASWNDSQLIQQSGRVLTQGESNRMVCCMLKKYEFNRLVVHLLSVRNRNLH